MPRFVAPSVMMQSRRVSVMMGVARRRPGAAGRNVVFPGAGGAGYRLSACGLVLGRCHTPGRAELHAGI